LSWGFRKVEGQEGRREWWGRVCFRLPRTICTDSQETVSLLLEICSETSEAIADSTFFSNFDEIALVL
jgi:hypothetical protein